MNPMNVSNVLLIVNIQFIKSRLPLSHFVNVMNLISFNVNYVTLSKAMTSKGLQNGKELVHYHQRITTLYL